MDAKAVALGAADGRPRHLAVVAPRRKEDPGRDLELELGGLHVVLPQRLSGRKRGHSTVVEMTQKRGRIERAATQLAYGDHVVMGSVPLGESSLEGVARGRLVRIGNARGSGGRETYGPQRTPFYGLPAS